MAGMAIGETPPHGGLSASDHSAQLRKAVIASTIGTTIEWHDFVIYGTACRRHSCPTIPGWIFPWNMTGTIAPVSGAGQPTLGARGAGGED